MLSQSSQQSCRSGLVSALVFLIALQAGTPAWAWGRIGHRLTARIAERNLTPKAKEALDQLAGTISSTKGYIITLEGGTDSVGPADYNYDLSQRRANSVIQYLATKYQVPAHKIYVIGLGKDKPVETNKTSTGRADNRRVDVRLMTNKQGENGQPASTPAAGNNPSSM